MVGVGVGKRVGEKVYTDGWKRCTQTVGKRCNWFVTGMSVLD